MKGFEEQFNDKYSLIIDKMIELVKKNCVPEVLDYIGKNFSDVTDYIKSLIESTIYDFKKN